MNDDPGQTGQGMSVADVSVWKAPSRDVLLGYYEAVKADAREYLSSVSAAELEGSVIAPPNNQPRAVSELLGILVYDNIVHGGQIAYLRGFYKGMGWFLV